MKTPQYLLRRFELETARPGAGSAWRSSPQYLLRRFELETAKIAAPIAPPAPHSTCSGGSSLRRSSPRLPIKELTKTHSTCSGGSSLRHSSTWIRVCHRLAHSTCSGGSSLRRIGTLSGTQFVEGPPSTCSNGSSSRRRYVPLRRTHGQSPQYLIERFEFETSPKEPRNTRARCLAPHSTRCTSRYQSGSSTP